MVDNESNIKPGENMLDALKRILDEASPEQIEQWKKDLNPVRNIPTGWVSIEEHLPMMLARDFATGTPILVRNAEHVETTTIVCDHNVWYYMMKEAGVIEWFNE